MGHKSVLTEVEGLVHGGRNDAYGHPLDDFSRTAGMVNSLFLSKLREPFTPDEIGMIMCCVKLSRQRNAKKRDNMVDLAGYAECIEWALHEKDRREHLSETFYPIAEEE